MKKRISRITAVILSVMFMMVGFMGCKEETTKSCEHSYELTADGKNYVCAKCGDTKANPEYKEECSHDYVLTTDGKYYECTKCHDKYSNPEYKEECDHDYVLIEDGKYYECTKCHDKYENPDYEEVCVHDYKLTSDELYYECSKCHDKFSSGKKDVTLDKEKFTGEGLTGNMKTENYLFIGSSIANGYHDASDTSRTSMANMLREDYILASYKFFSEGKITERNNVYMRKLSDDEGVQGKYNYDNEYITLDGNGNGKLELENGTVLSEFEYLVTDEIKISLVCPTGYLYSFTGYMGEGSTVYKYTSDGNTLSALGCNLKTVWNNDPRYTASGDQIYMGSASLGYEGSKTYYQRSYVCQLEDAIYDHADVDFDKVYIQLSTNDLGQYIDTNKTHILLGNISDTEFDISKLDVTTSFGALEWMIGKIKEQWKNAEIVLFSCHMTTSDWNLYRESGLSWDEYIELNSDYSKYDSVSEYAKMRLGLLKIAEKWNVSCIDLWGNEEVNAGLRSDYTRYFTDGTHLTETGYSAFLYQTFRKALDGRIDV